MVLASIVIFIVVFQCTQGSGFWIYVSEIISSDSVMGVCLFIQMLCMTLQSMTTQLILSSGMGVTGLFMMLGFIQVIGVIILAVTIKETSHLSPQQKKEVYWPTDEKAKSLETSEK